MTTTTPDDGTIDRLRWNPLPNELAAFKQRDIEMCIVAIERDPRLTQVQTLFSHATWEAAQRIVQSKPKESERQVA